MTVEWKRLMELEDFTAIVLKCKDCGTSVAFPLDKTPPLDRLRFCPNCHEDWFEPASFGERFASFASAIFELRQRIRSADELPHGFRMALQSEEKDC